MRLTGWGTGGVLKVRAGNDKPDNMFRTHLPLSPTKAQMEGAMSKFIPALKIVLAACIVFLASLIVFGLAVGANKPFQPAYALIMGLIAFGLLSKSTLVTPNCPTCGTRQPAVRTPISLRQTLLGGWTCANCGTEIDRHGKALERKA
jgi:predicted RNA-binding Zn-ribbon protein involved in translation (DUF1610 family)